MERFNKKQKEFLEYISEQYIIFRDFVFEGCECVQYGNDNFFAIVPIKDGKHKEVSAKSLDELKEKISIEKM